VKTRENNPKDWILLAEERLQSADALVHSRGVCCSAIELLQESLERYLKGFLISKNWKLERIHDLNRLLDLCLDHHPGFSKFAPLAQSLTEQFWAQHYPGDDLSEVGEDYPELRRDAQDLIQLINEQIG
jgi:HEPN domain-containing protein